MSDIAKDSKTALLQILSSILNSIMNANNIQ